MMGETLETCRRLYNRLLDDRIENRTGAFAQKRALTERRRQDKYLKQAHSQVLQDVVFRLDKAFGSFFAGLSKFPKFKRKDRYNSFTYPQWGGFKIEKDGTKLHLSMIGRVRIRLHRQIVGRMKTCTIIQDIDQWYTCVTAESEALSLPSASVKPAMGVDFGVSSVVALSDGTVIPAPRFLKKSAAEIRALQKSLSRKLKGSKNRENAKARLAKAWRRVRNRRNDFAHKLSLSLADGCGTIVFEDLEIGNMVRNHSLASAILDACWGKTRLLTAYKAERRGGRVVLVQPSGTSQGCSVCGNVQEMPLSERVFSCERCGLVLDRDVNAARNVLARGLERAPAEAEPLPVIRIGKFGPGSKKPTSFSRG
jgi:putative transposase